MKILTKGIGLLVLVALIMPQSAAATSREELLQEMVRLLQLQLTMLQAQRSAVAPITTPSVTTLAFDSSQLGSGRSLVERYDFQAAESLPAHMNGQAIFARLLELLPTQYEKTLQGFFVYSEQTESSDALVLGRGNGRGVVGWWFGINETLLQDRVDAQSLDELLVHEIGHVILLNEDLRLAPATSCHSTVRALGSCPNSQSIEMAYIQKFWPQRLLSTSLRERQRLDAGQYGFVSDYAAENPGEDFAEVVVAYVLEPSWMDTDSGLAQAKIDFVGNLSAVQALNSQVTQAVR